MRHVTRVSRRYAQRARAIRNSLKLHNSQSLEEEIAYLRALVARLQVGVCDAVVLGVAVVLLYSFAGSVACSTLVIWRQAPERNRGKAACMLHTRMPTPPRNAMQSR